MVLQESTKKKKSHPQQPTCLPTCPGLTCNIPRISFIVLLIYLSFVHIYCHIVDKQGDGTFYLTGVPLAFSIENVCRVCVLAL